MHIVHYRYHNHYRYSAQFLMNEEYCLHVQFHNFTFAAKNLFEMYIKNNL